jgi:hypothetical protein
MAKTKTKTKTLIISGPMDAKHVGGINVMGSGGPNVDDYFTGTAIMPDELPSHTFVATGKTEVPKRSDTIAGSLRRSISLKRSLSRLRRKSISHHPETPRKSESEPQAEQPMSRSESANHHRPLRMQSSMSRLRQRVGLDRELYDASPVSKTPSPEPEIIPEPVQKDDPPPLPNRKALARLTTTSSIYSDFEPIRTSVAPQRQPSIIQRQPSTIRRRPSPIERMPSDAKQQRPQPSNRPKRADSGTAIALDNVPVQERPIPFKEIMAVSSFAERMVMYKKTREYWASADHGLLTWTESAVRPRTAVARS